MSPRLETWILSVLFVFVVIGICMDFTEAKRSEDTRLSNGNTDGRSYRGSRQHVTSRERKPDSALTNEEREGATECTDCIQAPVINIRVTSTRRRGRGRGRERRNHGRHRSRTSDDIPTHRSGRPSGGRHQTERTEDGRLSGQRERAPAEHAESAQSRRKEHTSSYADAVIKRYQELMAQSEGFTSENVGKSTSAPDELLPPRKMSTDSSDDSSPRETKQKHSKRKHSRKHDSEKSDRKSKAGTEYASTTLTPKPSSTPAPRAQKDDSFSWSSFWNSMFTDDDENSNKDENANKGNNESAEEESDISTTRSTTEGTTRSAVEKVTSTAILKTGDSDSETLDGRTPTDAGVDKSSGSQNLPSRSESITSPNAKEDRKRKIRRRKKKKGRRGHEDISTDKLDLSSEVEEEIQISPLQAPDTTVKKEEGSRSEIDSPHGKHPSTLIDLSESTGTQTHGHSSGAQNKDSQNQRGEERESQEPQQKLGEGHGHVESRNRGSDSRGSHSHRARGHSSRGEGSQSHTASTDDMQGPPSHKSQPEKPKESQSSRNRGSHSQSHGSHGRGGTQPQRERLQWSPPSPQVEKHSDLDESDRRTSSKFLSSLYPEGSRDNAQSQGEERRTDQRTRYGSRSGIRTRPLTGGRGRDFGDAIRRPAAVDRLEQQRYPGLADATERMVRSMNKVVGILNSRLQIVHQDYDFVFNGTRYNIMMGVREQLKGIAKANDVVYNAVLQATLLTKDIYMRAHRSRLTGPTTRSLSRPEMSLPSLSDVTNDAYTEQREAERLMREVHELERRQQKLEARIQQVREKFQDDFARNDLRTLVYYINSTSQKLNQELNSFTSSLHARRNQNILYGSKDNIDVARELLVKANDNIASSSQDYRGNYKVVQDWKRLRTQPSDDGDVGPPVPFRQRPPEPADELSSDEVKHIRDTLRYIQRIAEEQRQLADEIERILRPSINLAKRILERDDAKDRALLASWVSRIQTDGKKLYSLLELIRIQIGAEQELIWTTSSSKACPGDDSDCLPEGSGDVVLTDGEEGSAELPSTTDDEDFVFVDEKQPAKRRPAGPTPLDEFTQKLSVHVDGLKLRSRDVLERADQLYEATEVLSTRWAVMKETTDMAERARKSWLEVQQVNRNVTEYVSEVSEVAKIFSQEVDRSHDEIEVRMKKVVEIADRKLKEVQARRAGGAADIPETDKPANDEAVLVDAVQKVTAVQENQRAIQELRRDVPRACNRASARLNSLHNSTSHLRQQVNKAKALLQTLQLSISKTGSGHLSIPTDIKDPTPSLTTTMDVCLKTTDTEGPVVLVKGNNSATFSLTVDDGQVAVSVFDKDGYNLDSVTSDLTLKEGTWYNVKVTRVGKHVNLKVTSSDESEAAENGVAISSMEYIQPPPIHAYIGGAPDTEPFSVGSRKWEGCLGGLRVNRRALSLLHTSSEGEPPKLCADHCSSGQNGGDFVFSGAGFLHFSADVLPTRTRMQSVHFRFRTHQGSAALLHLVNQRQRFLLRVLLTDGSIMIDTTTPTESIILRSRDTGFNDGKFHSLKVQYRDSTTYPEIDGVDGGFTIERTRPRSLNGMADGVVVGAFVTSAHAFEESQYRPLIGCIGELQIDDKPLSIVDAKMSTGVFVGSCDGQDFWSNCVAFGTDSSGIDLGELDKSGTVVLVFSPDARGPLLGYARDGKFEAEIAVTDEGVSVTTEDDEVVIPRRDDLTEAFSMMTITDDGKIVTYSVWSQKKEMAYGGFWDTYADTDGPHQFTVAMPLDSSDRILVGAMAQLVIGERYIDLGNYTLTNNLSACKRPLPDLVTSEVLPEVTPDKDDVDSVSTCSRDIQCPRG